MIPNKSPYDASFATIHDGLTEIRVRAYWELYSIGLRVNSKG